jgi:hypothetical protein
MFFDVWPLVQHSIFHTSRIAGRSRISRMHHRTQAFEQCLSDAGGFHHENMSTCPWNFLAKWWRMMDLSMKNDAEWGFFNQTEDSMSWRKQKLDHETCFPPWNLRLSCTVSFHPLLGIESLKAPNKNPGRGHQMDPNGEVELGTGPWWSMWSICEAGISWSFFFAVSQSWTFSKRSTHVTQGAAGFGDSAPESESTALKARKAGLPNKINKVHW